jgi:hypothetical protein
MTRFAIKGQLGHCQSTLFEQLCKLLAGTDYRAGQTGGGSAIFQTSSMAEPSERGSNK